MSEVTQFLPILLLILMPLQSEPPSEEALEWFRKADELIGTPKEYSQEQVDYLLKAIELAPDLAPAHYNLAIIYRHQGRFDEAVAHCDRLIEISPEDARGYAFKARLLLEIGETGTVLPLLEKAVEMDPDDYIAWSDLGRAAYLERRYERAAEAFARVVESNPAPDAYFDLALAQQSLEQFDEAVENYQRYLAHHPESFEAHYYLGLIYRLRSDDKKALEHWLEAERHQPDDPDLARELGSLYLEMGNRAEAEKRLNQLEAKSPQVLANLGILAKEEGRFPEAARLLRSSLMEDPRKGLVWGHLGDVLAALDQHEEAEAAYRKAIELDPSDFDSTLNLGSLLANQGREDESRGLLERSVELRPDSGEPHFTLGIVLERIGRSASAREHYQKALDKGFDSARLRFRLAVLESRAGRRDEAMTHLAACFAREPEKYVPIVFQDLRAVTGDFDSIRYTGAFKELMDRYQEYWTLGEEPSPASPASPAPPTSRP